MGSALWHATARDPLDWLADPATLFAGETGTVVVKLDDPGVYAFRCDFHATLQLGTLTVR